MGFLLVLSSALILYGTLYPFNFTAGAHPGGALQFVDRFSQGSSRDAAIFLSNIVLFLPFGFFAMQSLLPKAPRLLRLFIVVILGGSLSLSIECTQVYIPDRVTSIYDFILNTTGTFFRRRGGLDGLARDNWQSTNPVHQDRQPYFRFCSAARGLGIAYSPMFPPSTFSM